MLIHRRLVHGMQGRADHRDKGRFNTQDSDGWQKQSMDADSSTSSVPQLEVSNVHVGDHRLSIETSDRSAPYQQARRDGESVQSMSDPIANQAQVIICNLNSRLLLARLCVFN